MEGQVKFFLPSKGYGYINGVDNKDYFFHISDFEKKVNLTEITDGCRVQFDESLNEKGYKALAIIMLKEPVNSEGYPPKIKAISKFILTKKDSINNFVTIRSNKYLAVSSNQNPNYAKSMIINNCKKVGANSALNLRLTKSVGKSGNYRFTVHNYSAVPSVRMDTKHPSPLELEEQRNKLDSHISKVIEENNTKRMVAFAMIVVSIITISTYIYNQYGIYIFWISIFFFTIFSLNGLFSRFIPPVMFKPRE